MTSYNDTPGQGSQHDSGGCGHLFVPQGDPVADRLGLGAVALRYAALGLPVRGPPGPGPDRAAA